MEVLCVKVSEASNGEEFNSMVHASLGENVNYTISLPPFAAACFHFADVCSFKQTFYYISRLLALLRLLNARLHYFFPQIFIRKNPPKPETTLRESLMS